MSRKTRRHPGAKKSAPTLPLRRIGPGSYETTDGLVTIENMNDGKRDACWIALDKVSGARLASGETLATTRRRLQAVRK